MVRLIQSLYKEQTHTNKHYSTNIFIVVLVFVLSAYQTINMIAGQLSSVKHRTMSQFQLYDQDLNYVLKSKCNDLS